MSKRLVVIGGTAAGLSAASKAKRNDPQLSVTVFERSGYVSYGSCGLPYYVGGIIAQAEDLISLTAEQLSRTRDIQTHIRHEVTAIDRAAKEVTVCNLETGQEFIQPYDHLVIATGAVPLVPPIAGIDAQGVYCLRSVEDGIALRKAVEQGARRAVVIGGGLIGLETAEQLSLSGIRVEVVEAAPRLLGFLSDDYAGVVERTLRDNGVILHLGTTITEILTKGGVAAGVKTSAGQTLAADFVLVSVGAVPNTRLAKACGLSLGLKDAIVVDKTMGTSDPSVWACGDCVEMRHLLTGQACYVPLGTTANKQGRIAGDNITGRAIQFPGVLGSQVTKVFALYISSTGLTMQQAREAGFDPVSCAITKSDRASYYPGGTDNHLTLVFERKGGRLLGAQGVGGESIAGRVNVLVAAITAGMTVGELNELDLVYSPSVAPVYDPILIAASQALKLVEDGGA